MKILNVVGARPNFMKIAPLCRAFEDFKNKHSRSNLRTILVHTGQHYDYNLSAVFFKDLDIPKPDVNLGVGSGTHAQQTAGIMLKFEKLCLREKPDLVIVVGDVNSTLACSITAAKLLIPIAHVEAGLRSFDRSMPEEINRIITDVLSTYLFTTCLDAEANLKREGISKDKIYLVGNVMIDSLYYCLPKSKRSTIKSRLGLKDEPYVLVTLHRPPNVDDDKVFTKLISALAKISAKTKVIFPMHPRARKKLFQLDVYRRIKDNKSLEFVEAVGYIDFLNLMKDARIVITDSGGIQEETTVLGVPCLTLRANTERPITIREGTNILVGKDTDKLLSETDKILNGKVKKGRIPVFWDGEAAKRIVEKITTINKSML